MFDTVVSSLSIGTKFMCPDTTDIYCVTKVYHRLKIVIVAENMSYGTSRIMAGHIHVCPLYSL